MSHDLSTTFTGLKFENPFLLASAPPTESEDNIMNAFAAGWGGVVTKTIGMHPVVNVAGPRTKFLRHYPETGELSMNKGRNGVLHSSWNWELISDKTLDWWLPRLGRIKKAFPNRVLIASIMAGSGSDKELDHWRTLATSCQQAGVDGLELNLSCPHMDRPDMGSNIAKDQELCSFVTQVVKEVARVPIWAKLTPATSDIVVEASAVFRGGADAVSSTNTFPSLPLVDPQTLEFEINVDGFVSSGGLGDEVNLLLRVLTLPGAELVLPLACHDRVHDAGVSIVGWLGRIGLRVSPHLSEMWDSYGSLADSDTRMAFVHTLRSVVDISGQRVSATDRLYLAAAMPTLIVWGDHDRIIPVEQGRATHEAMPGSRLEIFEGTGHYPHCEHPDRFVAAFVEFMRTTDPAVMSASG